MRTGRVILGTVLFFTVGAVIWWAMTVYWDTKQPKPRDYARLVKAMQEFAREKKAAGETLPHSVSVKDLVSSGYLSVSDVEAFSDMDVSLSLNSDTNRPQDIVIRVRFPDGTVVVESIDGTVKEPAK